MFFKNEVPRCQKDMNRKLTNSKRGTEPVNKNSCKMLLPATAPATMVDVNEEYFVV